VSCSSARSTLNLTLTLALALALALTLTLILALALTLTLGNQHGMLAPQAGAASAEAPEGADGPAVMWSSLEPRDTYCGEPGCVAALPANLLRTGLELQAAWFEQKKSACDRRVAIAAA
jgi:hypothetical protein